jgi:hypothetical protein
MCEKLQEGRHQQSRAVCNTGTNTSAFVLSCIAPWLLSREYSIRGAVWKLGKDRCLRKKRELERGDCGIRLRGVEDLLDMGKNDT